MRDKTSSFDSASVVSLGSKAAGNILIIGEKLRYEMGALSLLRDRRYRLRWYQHCFVGRDVVDWLVKNKQVKGRSAAIMLMNILQKYNILHHVCDDHLFKDEMLFYRFRVDDKTLPESRESRAYVQGMEMFHRATSDTSSNPLLKLHTEAGNKYEKSFYGAELATWLLKTGQCTSRQEALSLGKDLLEADIIRHVTMDHHFKDERVLYQFHPALTDLEVSDLLTLDQEAGRTGLGEAAMLSLPVASDPLRKHSNSSSSDSSMDKNSLTGSKPDVSSPDQNQNRIPNPKVQETPGVLESPDTPSKTFLDSHQGRTSFSSDDLRQNESLFRKQEIKIVGDSVGFGLVIRGNGPTYVQTVDPTGPAAAAGLKVRQYLSAVNGIDVLAMNHTDVAKLILANPFELSLVVMQFSQDLTTT